MFKGAIRFTETAVLLSAILGIYGFTFLTVFSLNPKNDGNSSILGASDSEANKATIFPTITNISEDVFEFRTSLERYSDSRFVYTISFLNDGNTRSQNILNLVSNQNEPFYGSYTFSGASLDTLGMRFKKNDSVFEVSNSNNRQILITESGQPETFGVEFLPSAASGLWETVKITIEL